MADEAICTAETIQKFIVENGGKVSNKDLVKHFKKFLSEPNGNARTTFKDYVNTVATIKVEDGIKFVILKKRGYDEKGETDSNSKTEDTKNDSKKCRFSDNKEILHSHSSPSILDLAPPPNSGGAGTPQSTTPILWSSDLPPGHVPQAPPRRKYSVKGKENRGAKYEESIRQIYGEKESVTSPRDDEIRDVVSPGSVKEKAHKLNKMATESDVPPLKQNFNPSRRREHRDKETGDEDTCSISTLDPRRKEWILKSSHCDYHELVRLLREEPKLAFVKDNNKYTALHWAAKQGSLDVIKLMAGTHKLDPNAKTSGGYTTLHLAAIHGREEIMEILINTYDADPSIRDHSGKRPLHYMPKKQAERFLMMFPHLSFPVQLFGKIVSASSIKGEKESSSSGLMRMGSLNSKVKKASVLSAGGRAITRMKSWGSADNIPDRAMNSMPPPKTFPKKKKARKYTDIIGISENWRGRSPDSDSDSATGFAS